MPHASPSGSFQTFYYVFQDLRLGVRPGPASQRRCRVAACRRSLPCRLLLCCNLLLAVASSPGFAAFCLRVCAGVSVLSPGRRMRAAFDGVWLTLDKAMGRRPGIRVRPTEETRATRAHSRSRPAVSLPTGDRGTGALPRTGRDRVGWGRTWAEVLSRQLLRELSKPPRSRVVTSTTHDVNGPNSEEGRSPMPPTRLVFFGDDDDDDENALR